MLNFAEQTGSGAVIVVWSFLLNDGKTLYMKSVFCECGPVKCGRVDGGCPLLTYAATTLMRLMYKLHSYDHYLSLVLVLQWCVKVQ